MRAASPDDGHEVTRILCAYRDRPAELRRRLIPAVYGTLREMAAAQLRHEPGPQITLQPTALVHEAFLRVCAGDATWENRRHFFGAAAEAMRRILIERVRRRRRLRHGGEWDRAVTNLENLAAVGHPEDPLLIDEALDRLEEHDARKALVVKLRYFVGLSIDETAEVLALSRGTVKLDWVYSQAWLRRALRAPRPEPGAVREGP